MAKKPKKDSEVAALKKAQGKVVNDEGSRIVKVISKQDKISVNSELVRNDGSLRTSHEESSDKANPEFYKAMNALGRKMAALTRMDSKWAEHCRLIGVSVDYSKDEYERMGMIATFVIPILHMGGVITINTPRIVEKIQGAKGGGVCMDDATLGMVKTVLREAQKYVDGDRAQKDIEDEKPEKETKQAKLGFAQITKQ